MEIRQLLIKNYHNIEQIRINSSLKGGRYITWIDEFIPNFSKELKKELYLLKQSIVYEPITFRYTPKINKKSLLLREINEIQSLLLSADLAQYKTESICVKNATNFNELNTTEQHPAFAQSDTFFISPQHKECLKTHTSAEQKNMFQKMRDIDPDKPLLCFHIGPCYRNDSSKRHLPKFHQIEITSQNIEFKTFVDSITQLISLYLGVEQSELYIRRAYFPFVALGTEIDFREMEIAGLGITRNSMFNLDPKKIYCASGFGIERLIMAKYNIKDINELL